MKRVHIIVSGRVHGVFFRAETRNVARQLGLHGWVRNTDDGNVEVVAEGSEKELAELIGFCNRGPSVARVDNVSVKFSEGTSEFKGFSIRY